MVNKMMPLVEPVYHSLQKVNLSARINFPFSTSCCSCSIIYSTGGFFSPLYLCLYVMGVGACCMIPTRRIIGDKNNYIKTVSFSFQERNYSSQEQISTNVVAR